MSGEKSASIILGKQPSHVGEFIADLRGDSRYQLKAQLAQGGMGVIFEVFDHDLGRVVAAKSLRDEWRDADSLRRFVEEARATSRLEHPNILPIYDLSVDDEGVPFFTMPKLEGQNLADIIKRLKGGDKALHEEFSFARRLTIIRDLCDALDFAHQKAVIHRDIKPDNVMLGPFGEVLLLDWGLAGQHDHEEVVGTPGYMAPEVLRGQQATAASDMYGLGALMYEFFTLEPAHRGSTPQEQLQANLDGRIKTAFFIAQPIQGRVGKDISHVIMKLLRKQPGERYTSARAVAEAVQACLDGQAPVVCVCTGAKRVTSGFSRLIDQFGVPAVFFALLWLALPLVFGGLIWSGMLVFQ